LQTKPNGQKWRRQHPFGSYILDFYCHKIRLSVELDGANHLEEEGIGYDQERTKFINAMGVKELRFTNNRIKSDFDTVINSIMETSL